jgi:methylenetetrahydrofolate--tRNA-(uracil-5-)-methyltransferase
MQKKVDLIVIGGGLAGCEAAWQAARRGVQVALYEMRPSITTGAHISSNLGELVCSNSLGSNLPDRAQGLLKHELRQMGSLLLECAEYAAVPAGGALAVDRELFSNLVTEKIISHPKIEVVRQEVKEVPARPAVIASGPLTSPALNQAIEKISGKEHLYFFDAIAPIVTLDSINFQVAFRASRYGRGEQEEGDYINCPMNEGQYQAFVQALSEAERIELQDFEQEVNTGIRAGKHQFFEGCLPVEVLAQRDPRALAFGPLRPVGLIDPRTGRRPFAVVQLRQDNLAGSLFNLVGFQTNLKFPEQRRVFRLIPGLEKAEFVRFGQMHRNTFIFSPEMLLPSLQTKARSDLFFAGQITGAEGYTGNIGTGLLAGLNAGRFIAGKEPLALPETSMLGALCHYLTHASPEDFQPMKANYGLLPPLEDYDGRDKRLKARKYGERSSKTLEEFLNLNEENRMLIKTDSR